MNLWTLHRRRWLAVSGMILAWFGSLPIDMKLLWVITFMVWWNIPVLMGVVSSRTAVPPVLGSEDSLNGLMSKKKLVWIIYYCLCGHQVSSLVDHLWMILDWRVIESPKWCPSPPAELQRPGKSMILLHIYKSEYKFREFFLYISKSDYSRYLTIHIHLQMCDYSTSFIDFFFFLDQVGRFPPYSLCLVYFRIVRLMGLVNQACKRPLRPKTASKRKKPRIKDLLYAPKPDSQR